MTEMGGGAAAVSEGLPHWAVPTSFPHITNFMPQLRSRNRRGSILRSMSKHMEARVVVVGLDGAGKSTLVEQLAREDGKRTFISTTPTTPDDGRMELHEPSDTMRMMMWDMNGRQEARRATWYDQIERCDAVIYVFDCGDLGSLDEARDELWSILGDGRLAEQAPLLIWANKMDVEGSITETDLSERLALWTRPDCTRRQWCIQGSVMHDRGLGVEHGMKWLYLALSQKQPKKWTSTERHTVENEKVAETVTATKPNAKPAASAVSAAAHESSSGSARLCSTAESIVEGDNEEEASDDDGEGPQESELSVQKAAVEDRAARGTLSGTGTSAEQVAALRTVWNTPYVANFNANPGKSSSGSKGREFRVLLTGMEGAGKTTFMMQLQKKTAITWAPPATPVEGEMTMQKHREHSLIVWDMNGSVEGRAKWESHVDVVGALSAIIFVVDATEKFMFSTARLELERVMRFKNIDRNVPLLLVANKMDLNEPLDCTRVAEALALEKIHRRWRVQECSATLGTGVEQAMDWLCAAEGAKPRKYESDLLAEENSRLFSSDSGTALQARRSTSTGSPASRSADADIPAYQMGANYRVTKVGGKGKGQQLKLSCGAVGVNTFKFSGEHVKSYPYKELADWIQGTQSGKDMITLFKRDRNMAGTEFLCEKSGDASRIIADLNRRVHGVVPGEPVAQSASDASSQQSSDVSERLERARQLLWAALEADEQDLPAIAALGAEVEVLSERASRESPSPREEGRGRPRARQMGNCRRQSRPLEPTSKLRKSEGRERRWPTTPMRRSRRTHMTDKQPPRGFA